MGLGAGHVLDMINRMKQNRAQRPSNRSKFKENNIDGIYTKKQDGLKFKTVNESELDIIKQKIKVKAKKEQKKNAILLLIISLTVISILVGLFII